LPNPLCIVANANPISKDSIEKRHTSDTVNTRNKRCRETLDYGEKTIESFDQFNHLLWSIETVNLPSYHLRTKTFVSKKHMPPDPGVSHRNPLCASVNFHT